MKKKAVALSAVDSQRIFIEIYEQEIIAFLIMGLAQNAGP